MARCAKPSKSKKSRCISTSRSVPTARWHAARGGHSSGFLRFGWLGAAQSLLHKGGDFLAILEWAGIRAFFGLGKSGIEGAALRGCVFVVSGGELGAVNHQLGRDDDLIANGPNVHHVTLGQSHGGPDRTGYGRLAFVLDSNKCPHRD